MAGNKSVDVNRKWQFDVLAGEKDTVLGDGRTLLDVGASLSKLNHRQYRQGRQYEVKLTAGQSSTLNLQSGHFVNVYSLVPTWWVHGMWRQAKKAYDAALRLEKKQLAPKMLARWADFRVHSGLINGIGGPAVPLAGQPPILFKPNNLTSAEFNTGEFEMSAIENLDTGAQMEFSFAPGGTATMFSMIDEFTLTRNLSDSPDTPIAEMPYNELNANAESEDYLELQQNGNEPPYNGDAFPEYTWVRVATLGSQPFSNAPVLNTGYFPAPCGLVILDNSINGTGDPVSAVRMNAEVKSGNYKGVHAPAMG